VRSHNEMRPASATASAWSCTVAALAALFILAIGVGGAIGQPGSRPTESPSPEPAEIARALDRTKADPNLSPERTIKTLRWKSSTEKASSDLFASLRWIGDLFRWLDQSARLLMWAAGLAVAGVLAVRLVRATRWRAAMREDAPLAVPSHVQDMDIRPETLPEDVGTTARLLWDGGAHREALALLYRGMLSRLAHVHGIPIRDSTTEGECLVLTTTHLAAGRQEYAAALVRVWQRFVYGGQDTAAATVYALCHDFASALDSAPPLDARQSAGRP